MGPIAAMEVTQKSYPGALFINEREAGLLSGSLLMREQFSAL